ncbi:L-threonylcarbamoyladenylate synthase [Bacillus marinisedimentorum]|uniref:L-threonylcarbamoyladenylate synthase n=1 Tax=Bacillus marinisedimentorum TaxID=1821260 RepID=UPI0007E0E219
MHTKYWVVEKEDVNDESYPQLEEAALLLRDNETVAFPTETVYGLGANALADEAVDKIFRAKGRPGDNPLIVHIAEIEQLDSLAADVPETAQWLMDAFWPGALTLVLKSKEGVSRKVTAGLRTVAVRMPDHPVALALIEKAGVPIAAPSANVSGRPSPTSASHVKEDLDGRIAGIVDGGETGIGVESTVVDCTGEIPMILRPGGVTKEQLEKVAGKINVDPALAEVKEAPKSPGMKYTHYAPKAPLTIVEGDRAFIQQLVDNSRAAGKKVGVLTTYEHVDGFVADAVLPCGYRSRPETVARGLYQTLRSFDEYELDLIYSESFSEEGVGAAVMNRLLKAAGHRVINSGKE